MVFFFVVFEEAAAAATAAAETAAAAFHIRETDGWPWLLPWPTSRYFVRRKAAAEEREGGSGEERSGANRTERETTDGEGEGEQRRMEGDESRPSCRCAASLD